MTLSPSPEIPAMILLRGEAQDKLHALAATTSNIYVFALFAAAAIIYEFHDGLWGASWS